jgi:gliding motility-associated-like protein
VTATGSGTPFTYVWTPAVSNGPNASGLVAGDYSVDVTDANGCEATETITVGEPAPVTVQATASVNACAGTTLTVTDANGCTSAVASTTVNIGSALQPTLTTMDTSGCQPHCASFSAGPSGLASYAFTYGDGSADSGASHCYDDAGSYDVTLTVTDAGGCTGTITVPQLIHVLPTPEAAFDAPAVLIISDPAVTLQDRSTGADHWSWDLGAAGTSEEPSPLFTPSALGCSPVMQTVYTDAGCFDSTTVEICVEDEYALYVPNTFTPNDDGMNDVFNVVTSVGAPSFFRLLIFDRWGSVIFTAEKPGQFWDGDGTPEGIYSWTLEMRDSRDKLHKERGHILLLR